MNTAENISFAKLVAIQPGRPLYTLRKAFSEECFSKILQPLLHPCEGFVEELPCSTYSPKECPPHCFRKVMYYEPEDRFIAYCPEFQAPDETIDEKDLQMLNANLPFVLKDFSSCLHIRGKIELFMDDKLIWCLGELSSSASKRHPVFFVASLNSNIISDKIRKLLLHKRKASLIFTSGNYVPDSQIADLLQTAKVSLFNIDECANIGDGGKVSMQADSSKLFADFIGEIQTEKSRILGFDFPAGTSWKDMSIHFIDAMSLSIDINGSVVCFEKEVMQLGDAQWTLLQKFADGYGKCSLSYFTANEAMKKRLKRLNEHLMRFFHSPEPHSVKPIYLNDGIYECRFKLKPDWHSTKYHAKKRQTP